MRLLRFHEGLYDGFAVDEAAKVYAPFAKVDLEREGDYYVVKVTLDAPSEGGFTEDTIAVELANYALGKTVEKSASAPLAPAGSSSTEDGASTEETAGNKNTQTRGG